MNSYLDNLVLRAHAPAWDVEPVVPSIFAPVETSPIEPLGTSVEPGELAASAPIDPPSRALRIDGDVVQTARVTHEASDRPDRRRGSQDASTERLSASESTDRLFTPPSAREAAPARDAGPLDSGKRMPAEPRSNLEAVTGIATPVAERRSLTSEAGRGRDRHFRRLHERDVDVERRERTVDVARNGPPSTSRDGAPVEAPSEPAGDFASRSVPAMEGELTAMSHRIARVVDARVAQPQTRAAVGRRHAAPATPHHAVAPHHERQGVVSADSAEGSAHTVHVTIGRLEVRVTPPGSGARTDRAKPSSTSLEEYVRSRSRGAR